MVEKHRVDRLAYRVVAAEGEGDVGDTAGDQGVGQVLLDLPGRLDEVDTVVVVLFDTGGDFPFLAGFSDRDGSADIGDLVSASGLDPPWDLRSMAGWRPHRCVCRFL
jgi:hypothetical protein